MTDRVSSLFVVLEHDISEDEIEPLVNAIKHMRNVADVVTHTMEPSEHIAHVRVRTEIFQKLFQVLKDNNP